ncbi:hypothetical protein PPL_06618 [Heterostelium album PN500]|uniref:Schlafen AlbA-2 domain-containing protein n=1 Tax=Heterostelium pallidum (strain ATCC 26659 / Pp 5 / PN500) TaxID=670386 RepID=D3BF85_HETP5|nr:hypothetical protein PPL_06618 [Heterostelium album PN500]EFA79799.1 hypothetical protein PPL_06618 [Heterostelium album PN500]|eukprot:XP_020431920.1 hypothetical protein PPL_06618 [Heterostelium album PN500]
MNSNKIEDKNPISRFYEANDILKLKLSFSENTLKINLESRTVTFSSDKTRRREIKADLCQQAWDKLLKGLYNEYTPRAPQFNNLGSLFNHICHKNQYTAKYDKSLEGDKHRCILKIQPHSEILKSNEFHSDLFSSSKKSKDHAVEKAIIHLMTKFTWVYEFVKALPDGERSRVPIASPFDEPVEGQHLTRNGTKLTENRNLELKAFTRDFKETLNHHIHGKTSLGKETKNVTYYLAAFLNSNCPGQYIIGVTDKGIVQGVPMNNKEKDDLLNALDKVLENTYPSLLGSNFLNVTFPKVKDCDTPDEATAEKVPRYLVVVEIRPNEGPHYPYFPDKKKSIAPKKGEASTYDMNPVELVEMIINAKVAEGDVSTTGGVTTNDVPAIDSTNTGVTTSGSTSSHATTITPTGILHSLINYCSMMLMMISCSNSLEE